MPSPSSTHSSSSSSTSPLRSNATSAATTTTAQAFRSLRDQVEMTSKSVNIALVLSYVFDWIVILVVAGVGAYLATITPNRRPFNVYDPTISFPLVATEQVPVWLLLILAIAMPAAVIFLISLLLVPGPTVSKSIPKSLIWKRKLWEWYAGWAGLGLSSAAAFFIISGMKNLFGKPRPHTLAACDPDIANLAQYVVGGFTNGYVNSLLVSAEICRQTDSSILKDTFRSFPSGHAANSAAGLVYLSLFLASKLAITIPFLAPRTYTRDTRIFSAFPSRLEPRSARLHTASRPQTEDGFNKDTAMAEASYSGPTGHNAAEIAARSQSAAPPIYLLVFAFAPTALAIYICATRFSDFYHFGFDLLFGLFIGTTCAIFSFRFYHLPISGGAGWAWGPRASRRAFWAGVGVGSYARIEGDDEEGRQLPMTANTTGAYVSGGNSDLEAGTSRIAGVHDVR